MLDLGDLGLGGEEILQVAVPTCGVVAFTEAAVAAQSITASMRPRTRLAVSVLVVQIGSITRMTNDVSISCTGRAPMTG